MADELLLASLYGDEAMRMDAEPHLPVILDVPSVFALASVFSAPEPVILEASLYSGRVCLEGPGWSGAHDVIRHADGRAFHVYTATNSSGQSQDLWIEEGIAINFPQNAAAPLLPAPHLFAGADLFSGVDEPEFDPEALELSAEIFAPRMAELTCSDHMTMDMGLLSILAPDGAILSGSGTIELTNAHWSESGRNMERDGLTFVEYTGQNAHGDTISLLIQQGIAVI